MTPRLLAPVLAATALAAAAAAAPALADEPKPVPTATMILGIVSAPLAVERPETAFDRSLREDGPRPAASPLTGEVLPDGSVRYGRVTVTVKNPCPPDHDEPMPLPGRRARK